MLCGCVAKQWWRNLACHRLADSWCCRLTVAVRHKRRCGPAALHQTALGLCSAEEAEQAPPAPLMRALLQQDALPGGSPRVGSAPLTRAVREHASRKLRSGTTLPSAGGPEELGGLRLPAELANPAHSPRSPRAPPRHPLASPLAGREACSCSPAVPAHSCAPAPPTTSEGSLLLQLSAPTSPTEERAHRRGGSALPGAPVATPPAEQPDSLAAPERSGQGPAPDDEAAGLAGGLEARAGAQPQQRQPPQCASPRDARAQHPAYDEEAGGLAWSGSARALRRSAAAAAGGPTALQAAAHAAHAPDQAARSGADGEAVEPGEAGGGGAEPGGGPDGVASPRLRVEPKGDSAAVGPGRSSSVGAKSPRLAPVKVPPVAASSPPGPQPRTPRSARSAGASPASPSARRTRSGAVTPVQCCQDGACAALCAPSHACCLGGAVNQCVS